MFEVVKDRPVLQIAMAMVGGAACQRQFDFVGLVGLPGLLFLCRNSHRWFVALGVFFLCGWGLSYAERARVAKVGGVITGWVEWPVVPQESKVSFSVVTEEGEVAALSAPSRFPVAVGERVRATGVAATPLTVSRHGELMPVYEAASLETVGPSRTPTLRRLQELRNGIDKVFIANLTHGQAQMASAMAFGEGRRVPKATREWMRRCGVYHIIVTAGLHVGIVAALIVWLTGVTRLPRTAAAGLAVALVMAYAFAAGATVPSMRAAVAIGLYLLAGLVRREPDALTALGGGAIYQVLRAPQEVGGASFVLSYVCAGSLILWMPAASAWIGKRLPRRRARLSSQLAHWAAGGLAVSAVVGLAVAPAMAYYFGEVPLLGIPANLLVVPALAPVLWSGWIGTCGSFLPGWASFWLSGVTGPCIDWILYVSEWLGGRPWSVVTVPAFSGYWIGAFYLVVFGLAKEWKHEVD